MYTKKEIEKNINDLNLDEAKSAIVEYEKKHPQDSDLLSLKTGYYMAGGEIEEAYTCAKEAVRRIPLNGEVQFNFAVLSEMMGNYVEAYIAYGRASALFRYNKEEVIDTLKPDEKGLEVLNKLIEKVKNPSLTPEEADRIYSEICALDDMRRTVYGLSQDKYREIKRETIGTWEYDSLSSRRYVGVFKYQYVNADA